MDEASACEGLVALLGKVATCGRKDLHAVLDKALSMETRPVAREQLACILDNMRLGVEKRAPFCQDTGSLQFFIDVGEDFPARGRIRDMILSATRQATARVPLRPNTVHPITGRNPGDNTGDCTPDMHVTIVGGSSMTVTAMLKGGGAENASRLLMLDPVDGHKAIPGAARELVIGAGGKPCPPVILGIGIGGNASKCMAIAKRALLRPLGQAHPDPAVAALERDILAAVNGTGIGAMGLGGDITCLAVHVETCMRHPASFPVGIVVQCHAHRHGTITVHADGSWIIEEAFA